MASKKQPIGPGILAAACAFAILSGGSAQLESSKAHAQTAVSGSRIIDACSFITSWEPARLKCYDMWSRWCPLIEEGDARAHCTAQLQAAKSGNKLPAKPAKVEKKKRSADRPANADGQQESATSRDPKTGKTISSVRNPDGSRTVTVKDADGNILERNIVPATRRTSASATDPATGITTKSVRNEDGSRTVTRTDASGKVLSRESVPATSPAQISSRDAAGNTTRAVGNADGSRTLTRRDAGGRVVSEEVLPADRRDEVTRTDASGTTTRSVQNEDGSRTVTVTDADGNVQSRSIVPADEQGEGREGSGGNPESAPEKTAKRPAPRGAKMLSDFCAEIGNATARANCYGFGKMVRSLCALMPASREKSECTRITSQIPEALGPFDG